MWNFYLGHLLSFSEATHPIIQTPLKDTSKDMDSWSLKSYLQIEGPFWNTFGKEGMFLNHKEPAVFEIYLAWFSYLKIDLKPEKLLDLKHCMLKNLRSGGRSSNWIGYCCRWQSISRLWIRNWRFLSQKCNLIHITCSKYFFLVKKTCYLYCK